LSGLTNVITLSLLHPLNKNPIQHWTFQQESVIRIGRSTDNDVILYSAVVSRHHVEIHRTDKGWEVKSLGTNGTYLDGKRIIHAPVANGIVIRLARSGPNIQIQTTEEKQDPLKALLESRSRAAGIAFSAAVERPAAASEAGEITDVGSEDNPGTPAAGSPDATAAPIP
jgi:pSer/pThr/pTyr-binding forkhead associated (FHA) protein